MNRQDIEPGGLPTNPAQRAVPDFQSYRVPSDPQWAAKARDAERRLIAGGWVWPSQLACECDRFGVRDVHFGDRLCGVVVGYLRDCGESGRTPTVAEAEAGLKALAVPHNPDELFWILLETHVPRVLECADLVQDVLRGSEQRIADQLRELARDTLKITFHAIGCPKCQACATGNRPSNRSGLKGRAVA